MVFLRSDDETRDEARPHVGKIGGYGISERKLGLATAE